MIVYPYDHVRVFGPIDQLKKHKSESYERSQPFVIQNQIENVAPSADFPAELRNFVNVIHSCSFKQLGGLWLFSSRFSSEPADIVESPFWDNVLWP